VLRTSFNYLIVNAAGLIARLLWARQDLNLRPHAYQACALTS
jgi:hypothetical protein